jgi:phosphate/sulfate permease
MPTEKTKEWASSIQKLAIIAMEIFVQFKVLSRWIELKNLVAKEGAEIKKKLPLMGILLALLFSGIITMWATLFGIAVITLHMFIGSLMQCLGLVLFINILAVLLIVMCIANVFKKAVKPLTKK